MCATLPHYNQSSRASLNINISSSVDVKVIVKCDGRTIIIIIYILAASPPATASSCGPSARAPTGLRPVGVFNVDGPLARRSSPSATKFTQTGLRPVVRSERAYGPSKTGKRHEQMVFVTFFDLF